MTREQLQQAFKAEHVPAHVSAREWWQTVVMIAFDTGCRVLPIIAASPWKLDDAGYLPLKGKLCKLSPHTLDAVRKIGGAA